jgi:hypothetical protein
VLHGAQLSKNAATAFHAACSEGHIKAAVALLRCGVDHTVRALDGLTGLDIARKFNHRAFTAKVKPLVRMMVKEAEAARAREERLRNQVDEEA